MRAESRSAGTWELAAALAEHGAHKAPAARLFNVPDRWRMLDAYKADLAAAGVPYKDAGDKVADIHALRHTFISSLGAAGVNPKTMQALARHSTIALTMDKYTHLRLGDEAAGIAQLPDYGMPEAAGALRTGTDDAPAATGAGLAPSRPIATLGAGMGDRSTGGAGAANRLVGGSALGAHIDDPACRGAIRGALGQKQSRNETEVDNGADDSLYCDSPVSMRVLPMDTGGEDDTRGRSSIGRALALQARGCRFDPGRLQS